ncbi:MAG: hypothetical protein JWM11_5919 [Planctomycetaceae bacterium]|nr:hypothetical protein [Planctomycetaceae bacterium]
MFIEAQGIVYDATDQPGNRRIAFFTGLCALQSGDLLCPFQVGSGKHAVDSTLGLCRSQDGGNSWQILPVSFETMLNGVPGSLSGPALVEVEPGRLLLFATWFDRSDPTRPLFDPVTEGILHSREILAISSDNGTTWSSWQVLATPGLSGCAGTGPAVHWADGTIAMAFESFKEFDELQPASHGAWILVSRDGGRSFEQPLLVARDPENRVYYWDQRLCPAGPAGEFVGLFWTHDRAQERDLHVHLRHLKLTDSQLEVGPIQVTPIRGQIAAPLVLEDGRLLAFVVDRNRPGTMKLWVSHDQGTTWPEGDCLIVHTHDERAALAQKSERIDFAEYWEDMGKWSFGHPAILSLDNRRVLLAFYAGAPDRMSIHWSRVNLGE